MTAGRDRCSDDATVRILLNLFVADVVCLFVFSFFLILFGQSHFLFVPSVSQLTLLSDGLVGDRVTPL